MQPKQSFFLCHSNAFTFHEKDGYSGEETARESAGRVTFNKISELSGVDADHLSKYFGRDGKYRTLLTVFMACCHTIGRGQKLTGDPMTSVRFRNDCYGSFSSGDCPTAMFTKESLSSAHKLDEHHPLQELISNLPEFFEDEDIWVPAQSLLAEAYKMGYNYVKNASHQ